MYKTPFCKSGHIYWGTHSTWVNVVAKVYILYMLLNSLLVNSLIVYSWGKHSLQLFITL